MRPVLLAFLAGCATGGSLRPVSDGQVEAVWIIWHHTYGREDGPPNIRWKQGAELDCTDPNSGKPGFSIPDPDEGTVCREGLTMSFREVIMSWHGELSFSETALAHELLHVVMARELVFDPFHKREEWKPLEECAPDRPRCGIVDRANLAVREAGR